MSKILSGSPSHLTTPLAATITALANNGSGAIRATTSTPHYFSTTDRVLITTPILLGTFAIVVINATQFDLVGSTFTATSTGTATDQSLTPAILVPTDGDSFSAQISGLLSAFQGVLDRTQWLASKLRPALWQLALDATFQNIDLTFSLGANVALGSAGIANAQNLLLFPMNAVSFDTGLLLRFAFRGNAAGTGTNPALVLQYRLQPQGGSYGPWNYMAGSGCLVGSSVAAVETAAEVVINPAVLGFTGGNIEVGLFGMCTGAPGSVALFGDWFGSAQLLRETLAP